MSSVSSSRPQSPNPPYGGIVGERADHVLLEVHLMQSRGLALAHRNAAGDARQVLAGRRPEHQAL
jgi:hypothetical protein